MESSNSSKFHEVDFPNTDSSMAGCAIAIGVFDGLHCGHMSLIEACVSDAEENDCSSAVLTFDIDPEELFASEGLIKVMSNAQRLERLCETCVDYVFALKFDQEIASVSSEDFLDGMFSQYVPTSIHVGSDFRFGSHASGDVSLLRRWCDSHCIRLVVHDILEVDGMPAKSSAIRGLLSEGRLDEANKLLGHPYEVCGRVKHGRGEGAGLGFATANVDAKYILQDGVYAGYAIVEGKRYKAAISVGVPPTYEGVATDSLEAHILDFDGDLYGKTICIEFVERLAPQIKFDSTEALIAKVQEYIDYVRNNM